MGYKFSLFGPQGALTASVSAESGATGTGSLQVSQEFKNWIFKQFWEEVKT